MEQILRQKDIILVPFPFSDQSGTKNRPAAIISADKFNESSPDVIACAITSNTAASPYTVFIRREDWKDGLYSESCVKAGTIGSLDKRIILKKIGRLGAERFGEVMRKVKEILGQSFY